MADIFTDKTARLDTTKWPCGPINPQFTVPAVFRECQSLESQLHWLVGWLNHMASIDPDKLNDVIDAINTTLEDHETRITFNATNIANTRACILIDNRALSFSAAALDALVGTGVSGLTPTPGAKVNDTIIEVRTCTDTGKPSALIGRVTAVASNAMTYLVLVALHDDYATLKTQIDGVGGDVTNLTTKVEKIEGDVTNLETKVEGNTTNISNLTEQVSNNSTSISNLGDRVTNLEVYETAFVWLTQHVYSNVPGMQGKTVNMDDDNVMSNVPFADIPIGSPAIFIAEDNDHGEIELCIGHVTQKTENMITFLVDQAQSIATMDFVTNALDSIIDKIYQGGSITDSGTITWPNANLIPTGNLNIYSQDTDPKSGTQIAIKTHDNPNNSDLWFK